MNWKCQEDLAYEIRFGSEVDNQDWPLTPVYSPAEVTDCNRQTLLERFLRVRNNARAILEIGVCRNHEDSFTHVFLKNKKTETYYVGIDLDDKSFLNDVHQRTYTIRANSSDVFQNMAICNQLGVIEFDFIFIDGWHSINQVLVDWEYTRWLSPTGIVGLHDTTGHPGPNRFVRALDRNKWHVEENCCPNDYGIGFAWKKTA